MERLWARYELETPVGLDRAAAVIAGEQSSGTFMRLPGETDALLERAGARVERIAPLETRAAPALPCKLSGARIERGLVDISWPLSNMGTSLPNVMATVAGNLFELREVSALRLLDVVFPDAFAAACPGPAFGAAGTLAQVAMARGPMIGTIVKPSVGLSAEETGALAGRLAEAGIDFIKDDELQADGPACPFEARARAVLEALDRAAQRTGRRTMYAVNITGEVDEMLRRHDLVHALGGTCVMVSLHWIGLSGLGALRRHGALPIHGHRNGWGLFSRSPDIGVAYPAWQKIWRLAGADHLHVNGLGNKFSESDASVLESARAVCAPLFDAAPMTAMPVFSSAQTPLQVGPTRAALGHDGWLMTAGGGVIGHPGGIAAGVLAMRQAAEAAAAGVAVADAARDAPELAAALRAFGPATPAGAAI